MVHLKRSSTGLVQAVKVMDQDGCVEQPQAHVLTKGGCARSRLTRQTHVEQMHAK